MPGRSRPRGVAAAATTAPATPVGAVVADVAVVLLFVLSGRRTHAPGEVLAGLVGTAWPFLLGLAAAVLARRGLGLDPAGLRAGALTAAVTTVVGLLLRVLGGVGGAPASFVAVATGVLGLGLLGWRLLLRLTRRRVPRPTLAR